MDLLCDLTSEKHLVKSAKILELETDCSKRAVENGARHNGVEFNLTQEMEKDMGKMIAYICDLKRKNHELNLRLKSYESKDTTAPKDAVPDLRSEREKRRALETELSELKQILMKSDNQKIIALATKIEQLNAQQAMISERCNVLHKKAVADNDSEAYATKRSQRN
ncbi:hypothetical protein NECAME_12471 [Necator americanus]|uniref:Uncharacterized protein n=1 Tax=Necator americanus TaxID=51031 RepID=W2T0B2_NECAM|nr:hypothetical protein NECAME_12471 [Necator americanus]ETN75318.1 hypothetical protein NECAME_12471 [Necator americanus]